MSYITKEMTVAALNNMSTFHHHMNRSFLKWGMNFKSNLGRRNIVMSQTQEHFFAKELEKEYKGVESDGRTGKADIVISEIGKELECKLTSGNRGRSITYSFNTDWETLRNKGELDYLYVLCDEDFEKFCVLYFENLTVDDFYPPANGSRGKSRMKKQEAMKKCTVLVGSVSVQNHLQIKKINKEIKSYDLPNCKKSKNTKKYKSLFERLEYWQTSSERYSINLATCNEK